MPTTAENARGEVGWHNRLVRVLFDLAVLLNTMGRYEEAEIHLTPVLRRYERDFGFHGEWTTKCAEQMALALQGQEKIGAVSWSAVFSTLKRDVKTERKDIGT